MHNIFHTFEFTTPYFNFHLRITSVNTKYMIFGLVGWSVRVGKLVGGSVGWWVFVLVGRLVGW